VNPPNDPGSVSPRKRDDETGKYTEQYPTADFIDAIRELETPTTNDVAEFVGCSYDLAYRRLRSLGKEGRVSRRSVGGSFLWDLPDEDS